MVILVTMLIVALVPTRRYTWTFSSDVHLEQLAEPAICNLFFSSQERAISYEENASLQRMILSISLLAFGMLVRLCRIYRTPRQIYLRFCRCFQSWTGIPMKKLHALTLSSPLVSAAMTIILCRPALAVFLCCKILAHLMSSQAFKVRQISERASRSSQV